MELHLFHVFTFLSVALVGSYAALPSEVYWKSVLPNTPMPKSLQDLLPSAGKGGVSFGTGTNPSIQRHNINYDGASIQRENINYHYGASIERENINYHYGASIQKSSRDDGRIDFFKYYNGTDVDQLHNNSKFAIFFLEKDMHEGGKLNFNFIKATNASTFLPRQVANTIPFSSARLPEILTRFSVKPGSLEAEFMKLTITDCERKAMEGEEKYCTTSLESMIDFSVSKLGKNINAVSTEVEKESELQSYSIKGVKKMASDKAVVCHNTIYPYAVFYCHKINTLDSYKVSLIGDDGTKAEAVAVCHKDTSGWNPKHLAFKVLKVKPGTLPVCHFLLEDNVVWVRPVLDLV